MALLPVADALARILKTARKLPAEKIPLEKALGRVTAKDIIARRDQPPFDASAMDGYAVIQHDIEKLPAQLNLVGTSAAGHAFKGLLKPGQAVRILTGAPLPQGADTIVIQENVTVEKTLVTVAEHSAAGRHIRIRGLDFAAGHILVPANTELNARDIGLIASGNAAEISVYRKPNVAVLTTGDELVLPGQKARPDQISSSNSHALMAFAQSCGADVINLGIVRDDLKAMMKAVAKAQTADILVTTGGASVGDHDFAQEAFKRSGIAIDFWKIAMRPGKPFMFGTKGKLRVLGLPGNPVAALVCAKLFLEPLIRAMQQLPQHMNQTVAVLGVDLPANDGRQDYLRATLKVAPDGTRTAVVAAKQDSSMQRTLRNSQCLVIRPPHAPAAKTGEICPVLLLF